MTVRPPTSLQDDSQILWRSHSLLLNSHCVTKASAAGPQCCKDDPTVLIRLGNTLHFQMKCVMFHVKGTVHSKKKKIVHFHLILIFYQPLVNEHRRAMITTILQWNCLNSLFITKTYQNTWKSLVTWTFFADTLGCLIKHESESQRTAIVLNSHKRILNYLLLCPKKKKYLYNTNFYPNVKVL